jgi:hypothetical protein
MRTSETGGGTSRSASGFVGSLEQTPLAEVLQRIVRTGRSGDLRVTIPGAVKTVYFDRGFVVFASSDLEGDRLGESMIEAGRISRHEFALASMVMKASKRRFGETLVEAGIVSEEELGQCVAAQVNRIALSLFPAKSGSYSFDERPCSIPVGLMVSLSVYRILLEGVRRMTSQKLVVAGLPRLQTRLSVASEPPFTLDLTKLHPVEKAVLRGAGKGVPLGEIVEGVGGHKGVALRAAYALLSAGLLETVATETPARSRLQVQEETGTFVLSEIRQKVEAREEAPVPAPVAIAEPEGPPDEPPVEPAHETEPRVPEEDRTQVKPATTPSFGTADEEEGPATFLSRLRDWAKRRWLPVENALLHWVGSKASEAEAPPEVHRPPEPPKPHFGGEPSAAGQHPKREAVPPTRTHRKPPPAPVREVVEDIGVPTWSIVSEPEEEGEQRDKDESVDLRVGVPSWSMMDSPAVPDVPEVPEMDEPEGRGPTVRALGVPSWSMLDDPEPSVSTSSSGPFLGETEGPAAAGGALAEKAETPFGVLSSREAEPGLGTPMAMEPLSSFDNDLFVEGELPGNEEPSLLQPIPVEEIAFSAEAPEVEVEPLAELITDEHPASFPEEPAPPVIEPTPVASEVPRHEPLETRPETPPEAARTGEPDRVETAASRDEELRRIRQGGGETRLLRDVKLHFKLQDWEGAVPLLEQLLQISPGSALYRGMLARAMSRHPVRRKEAEEHFIEALRLAPQDAELHYWLGLYYKSFGLKARAYTEFRTTLRIDPKHEGARKQLAGDRKDDAVGAVIKKIFG